MQYLLYLRKSRADLEAEARGEGETLARHEKALLDLAKRLKLSIGDIYREIVSGESIAARPVVQKLLSEVEQGTWAGVLVMEVERLARGDTIDQGIIAQTFKYSNTKIITPSKIYNPNNESDEEYFEFGLFMSRREYKTINRRLQRGRIASVKEGKFVGNRPPYGYVRKKLEKDKGYTLEPHPEQADVVRMIFDLYTQGELQGDGTYVQLGIGKIVNRLNAMGVATIKGGKWSVSSVRGIINNPVYTGKIRWGWRAGEKRMVDGVIKSTRPRASEDNYTLTDGLHEPIVPADVFAAAKEITNKNVTVPIGNDRAVKNPLAGIVICGKCGHKMTRRPHGDRNHVDTLICHYTYCDNVSADLQNVEARVLDGLRQWLENYKLTWAADRKIKEPSSIAIKQKILKKAESELQTLEIQQSRLHDLLEQGVYTTDTFISRSRELSERIAREESNIAALKNDLDKALRSQTAHEVIIPKVEKLLEVYGDLDNVATKNRMLKEVLDRVVYIKNNKGRWHHSPDDFEIALFPRLSSDT